MLLHFQADAKLGWESPQVLSKSLVHVLENKKITAPLDNVTPQRGRLLIDLDRSLAPAQLVSCVRTATSSVPQVDTTIVPGWHEPRNRHRH